MSYRQIFSGVLCCLVLNFVAAAADLPVREKIEKGDWTIEFSPVDRGAAEWLSAYVAKLEEIQAVGRATKIELEPVAVEARSVELAKRMAEISGLPGRMGDFQKEIMRMLPMAFEMQVEVDKAIAPHVLVIWRKSELVQRFRAGEKVRSFTYDAATNEASFSLAFSWKFDADYKITERPKALGAIPVKQKEDGVDTDERREEMLKDVEGTMRAVAQVARLMYGKMCIALGLNGVIANALKPEFDACPNVQWIKAGITPWILRRTLIQTLNPEAAEGYLILFEQKLQAAFKSPAAVDLEKFPTEASEAQCFFAYAIFRNIAERHGNEAVTRLLVEFFKLKPGKRSTEAFDKICRKQLKQPLQVFVPRAVAVPGKVPETKAAR